MTIQTVNVIESVDGEIISLRAFPDTPEGNKEAESLFIQVCVDNEIVKIADDCVDLLDEGSAERGSWRAVIFHSQGVDEK